MNIKLICSDIDGTLLDKNRELSIKTIAIIKKLSTIPFILISSRMPKAMLHLQQELGITNLPMIAYNGGLIVHNGKVLDTTEINNNITENITAFCKDTNIHISLYHNDEWYVPTMDYWAKREQNNTKVTPQVNSIIETLANWNKEQKGAHKVMCMGEEKEIDTLVSFINNNYNDSIIGYRSKPTYLEISPKNTSKKIAIELLLKMNYPDLNLENVMAFGDNYNDIEMLKHVGIGVAVSNAKEDVLTIAKYRTNSNKEDGVALFLEDYFS